VLWVLPADFFDHGQAKCLSVVFFDQECFGCGMTRAIQHLMHFDFDAAWAFNKVSVIVLPCLLIIWAQELKRSYPGAKAVYLDLKNRKA
jgi:hypothetical protein